MENANQTNDKQLAWAVLSKANGNQLSQVIKITGYRDADETVAGAPDKFLKSFKALWMIPFCCALGLC